MDEFQLIERHFLSRGDKRPDVVIGSGDDAAVVSVPSNQELIISVDTLVADIHFPADISAQTLGHKLLAVNLSDCAAMGALPTWVTVAISAPKLSDNWLADFANGFFALAEQYHIQLIGGDVTKSNQLTLTGQIHGLVPKGKALLQTGAKTGEGVFVTGTLGDAALALANEAKQLSTEQRKQVETRQHMPEPRIKTGIAIRDIASACIDISDGLLIDLQRLLKRSNVGGTLSAESIPLSPALQSISPTTALTLACTGGDDYELCFTAPLDTTETLQQIARDTNVPITLIGQITKDAELYVFDQNEQPLIFQQQGYTHKL